MNAYWVEFENRSPVCVEADADMEARVLAQGITSCVVKGVHSLPYPAEPRIGIRSGVPSFCWKPNECKGNTSCPRRVSCSE